MKHDIRKKLEAVLMDRQRRAAQPGTFSELCGSQESPQLPTTPGPCAAAVSCLLVILLASLAVTVLFGGVLCWNRGMGLAGVSLRGGWMGEAWYGVQSGASWCGWVSRGSLQCRQQGIKPLL